MKPTWPVIVPSRGRADSIAAHALTALVGVPRDQVTVLAYEPELAAYRAAALPGMRVIPAPGGLSNVNQMVAQLYPDRWIIRLDDDIQQIQTLTTNAAGKPALRPADVPLVFHTMTTRGEAEHLTLVGISPTGNAGFMRHKWMVGLHFACGGLFAYKPDPALAGRCTGKEDYERTLLHYRRDGAVGRAQWVAVKRKALRGFAGGISDELPDRRGTERQEVAYLQQQFPGLVHPKDDRDGYPEITLRIPAQANR